MDFLLNLTVNKKKQYFKSAFEEMRFRDALKYGFYMLVGMKDDYLLHTSAEGPRKDLIRKYCENQIILISPILAHFSEYSY
jgi:leucyl-tRNA synthetase